MLKNSYKLKLTATSGWMFVAGLERNPANVNTSEYWLCILILEPLVIKLRTKLSFRMPSTMLTLTISRKEALAFHNCYLKGFIDNNEPMIMELFTQIDSTL